MINEKKKIMKAKLKVNEFQIVEKSCKFSNNLNILYIDILNKCSNNLFWECISISLQYLHVFLFAIDTNVSLLYNLI